MFSSSIFLIQLQKCAIKKLLGNTAAIAFIYTLFETKFMFKLNLTTKIFIGLILGIIAGYFYRNTHALSSDYENFANNIQILSDIFLRLIKMIIAPLVFSVLVVGIAKV